MDRSRGLEALLHPLADAILRVSRLVEEMPEVVQLDLNPLVACEPGRGVVAVDARIRVVSPEEKC